MYVRDARNRDEVWLLDRMEELGLEEASFRSRDYVIAVDEETNERAGFGRVRAHKRADAPDVCELTSIGVLPTWRRQGVGAHVVERLVDEAGDESFDRVYALTDEAAYLGQFGFAAVDDLPTPLADRLTTLREATDDPEAITPVAVPVDGFEMPTELRERFKSATPRDGEPGGPDPEEMAEEFGIDTDEATYKYDTGN